MIKFMWWGRDRHDKRVWFRWVRHTQLGVELLKSLAEYERG